MSTGGPKRLVLNSHRFLRDIIPEIYDQLLLGEEFDAVPTQGDPGLYSVIRDGNHLIVLTSGIQEEYFREAQYMGFRYALVLAVIQFLQQEQLILRPRLPGGVRNHPHVPNYHRAFLNDAIDANAYYFITERNVWLDRADIIGRRHGLRIVTPGGFIQREGL